MDWKTMKEIIDEIVSAKVNMREMEIENTNLREDIDSLCEDRDKLKEEISKLTEEKETYAEFYRNIRLEAVASPIIIGDLMNEVLVNEVIENVEEIRTVVVEETKEKKRRKYMSKYMKDKRKREKDEKSK